MHIAFDGGCFQQGILGGIYQVSRGILNAAKACHPDLQVTLVCDPRQGAVREEALAGLTWRPEIAYGAVLASCDPPEAWPAMRDAHVRFFVDGKIVPATLEGGTASYIGPKPTGAFAIVSRAAPAGDPHEKLLRGVRLGRITISGTDGKRVPLRVEGHDRRLIAGFLDEDGGNRWTDGAGFLPLPFFDGYSATLRVDVEYTPQEAYAIAPGPGADIVRQARRDADAAERARRLTLLSDDLRARGCTVYFANHFTPIHIPDMLNVALAHDLIPVLFPQYFHPDAQLNFTENLRIFAAADRVYTVSDCTRDDLIANTRVTEAQAVTAGNACSSSFSPRSPTEIQRTLTPLGLRTGGYILAVATIEPRKNHMRLLLAYLALRRRVPHCPDLVLVGNLGWDFEQLLALRWESGLETSVKILSDVPEDDLAGLYSGALFSAYISVYEGFGLPIIEAMASGCPVLTSDRSSMAEVAADAALLVNPYDVDAIADALHRLTTDAALRRDFASRGLARAGHYDWKRSSEIVFNDLAHLHGDA